MIATLIKRHSNIGAYWIHPALKVSWHDEIREGTAKSLCLTMTRRLVPNRNERQSSKERRRVPSNPRAEG